MRGWVLALVGSAACYSGKPVEGVACSPGTQACPDGQFCNALNVCTSTVDDAFVHLDGLGDSFVAPIDAPSTPFGAPTLIDLGQPNSALDDPTLTSDELQMIINIGNVDLMVATRQDRNDAFGPPVLIAELNSTSNETTPEFLTDTDIVFASARPGGLGGQDIYYAGRPSVDSVWDAPTIITSLSSTASESPGNLSEDGLQMVITSSRPGGKGKDDLYIARRPALDMDFEPAVNIVSVNTNTDDEAGFFADGGRTLYYSSDLGAITHIYVAHRASLDDDFGDGVELQEIEMGGNETDPWLSSDGKRLYFMSSASGVNQVYMAER